MAVFGDPDGGDLSQDLPDRTVMKAAGLHRHLQAGISGTSSEDANAIVLYCGYKDDSDREDVIIYTGKGERDPTGKHVKNKTVLKIIWLSSAVTN
jgi:putative restriction endonuclease